MPSPARSKPPPETEAGLQNAVIELARMFGYRVAHFRPARTDKGWRTAVAADGAGFPDLVLVGRSDVIFAELKTDKGKVSARQAAWIDALIAAGAEVYVWRPKDFDDIRARLSGKRRWVDG